MRSAKVVLVDGLEGACRATRAVEWIPGWHRVYPQCLFARWSSALDARWNTRRWPVHDADGDDAVFDWLESLSAEDIKSGHWHHW